MDYLNFIKHPARLIMSYVCPKQLASIYYRNVSNKKLNWKAPRDLNEIINWMKFNSDTTIWTQLADKYRVREYVESCGLEHLLVKLYGVWEKADDIDFSSLPNKFVLKTNHGSGTNLLVRDKSRLNIDEVKKQLNSWLRLKFGQETVEFHYLDIKPLIIAEELLEEHNNQYSDTLVDYKIWCFNGEPHYIWTCYNRTESSTYVSLYDIDWNYCPKGSIFNDHYRDGKGIVPKPKCLEQMLEAARILSSGHPQARIDFYVVDDRLYLGEITMSSQGGYMDFYTPEFLIKLGDCVDKSYLKL